MKTFNPQFPEEFDWETVDSITLSRLGAELALEIKRDLEPDSNREKVCGLRRALNIIARMVN